MVHALPGFAPGPGDELSQRTLPTFFGVLELLLTAGVTAVAEAAFQDRLWRPGLQLLKKAARIRIVHCTVDAHIARERIRQRLEDNPVRRAHENASQADDTSAHMLRHNTFDRVSIDAPSIEVDTTHGYRPGLREIESFVNDRG